MMHLLHPSYTLKIEVRDGPPAPQNLQLGPGQTGIAMSNTPHQRRWAVNDKTGCDDLLAAVRKALSDAGIAATVSLDRFEHKA